MRVDVEIISNTKQWDAMEKRLLRGSDKVVRVGWWGTRHHSGEYVAQIAAWNEEGHMNGGMFSGTYTPPRPFMRMGFLPSAKKVMIIYAKEVFDKIALGKTTWAGFNKRLGEDMVKLLQKTIWNWNNPPNSPVTIAIKGFDNPLIDTGNMYEAVKYKIVGIGQK